MNRYCLQRILTVCFISSLLASTRGFDGRYMDVFVLRLLFLYQESFVSMNRIFTFLFFVFIFSDITGQVSYCAVFGDYSNAPLIEVVGKLEVQCKIKINYSSDLLLPYTITKKFDGEPFIRALNEIFEGTTVGFTVVDDQTIELKNKSSLIKYISITNDFKNIALYKVFKIWETNYKIDIDSDYNDLQGIDIYGKLKDESLDNAFAKILSNTPLSYEITGPNSVRVFRENGVEKADPIYDKISTNFNIRGSVKDRQTGESLPFSNVLIQGTTIGTSTNVDGLFSILNVPNDTVKLEISYIGYISDVVKLNPGMDKGDLSFTLEQGGTLIDEITIAAVKKDQLLKASSGISKISMTPEIASVLPSNGEKDIFRSLQLLPGVSGTNESSSGLFVRGGTPDQNLILFDGFTVYHVDHLFGFFSAFNSNAIKDVQLYKGGYEAKYGGRLSSVVEMTGKDGNTNDFNMGFGASLLSVNGFVESPFAKGKGSFIVTGRRSFQSNFYSNLFDSFTGIGQAEDAQAQGGGPGGGRGGFGALGQTQVQPNSFFYDLNAKITYRPSP